MYKCEKCGFAFNEPEYKTSKSGSEYWGAMTYEEYTSSHCPECGCEDFEIAVECENCGKVFIELEEESPCKCLCQDCFNKYTSDFDRVYKLFDDDNKIDIKINALVANLLSTDEINKILHTYAKKQFGMGFCKQFEDFISDNAIEIGEAIDEMEVIEW